MDVATPGYFRAIGTPLVHGRARAPPAAGGECGLKGYWCEERLDRRPHCCDVTLANVARRPDRWPLAVFQVIILSAAAGDYPRNHCGYGRCLTVEAFGPFCSCC